MTLQIGLLFFALLLLPAIMLYSLWKAANISNFWWGVKALSTTAFILVLFFVGSWDWFSYYLRYLWLLLLVAVLGVALFRRRGKNRQGEESRWDKVGDVGALLLFVGALVYIVSGWFYSADPITLTSPLRDGRFYVGQGGNVVLLNYHNSNQAQQFALDIVELDALGRRAAGLYPSDLDDYVIFGTPLYAPCDGTVLTAVNDLPDQIPPETDTENLAGNHVVIECQEAKVVLAHIQQGSVTVNAGDVVTTDDQIGAVGNSGNTTEPHLHIHAVAASSGDILDGDGVPILLNDEFEVKNSLLDR